MYTHYAFQTLQRNNLLLIYIKHDKHLIDLVCKYLIYGVQHTLYINSSTLIITVFYIQEFI